MNDEKLKFKIGDKAECEKEITDQYILETVKWSGDGNPIHTDEEYAKNTKFERRIAHGLVCLGMVSNILGNQLPGKGSVLAEQTVKYLYPVYIGDKIRCMVEVDNITGKKIHLSYYCSNQNDQKVVTGDILLFMM